MADMDATMAALRSGLAANALFWLGAFVVQGAAVGVGVRLARDGAAPARAVPGVLLQLVVVGAGLVALTRAARGARAGLARAVQGVLLAFGAIALVGAVAAFFLGLTLLAIGAALSGVTEGAGFLAAVGGPCLGWFVALAASPMGAASCEPTRQLQAVEVLRSQRSALIMASAAVVAAAAFPIEGLPLLFLPLAAAIGAATGLLRGREVTQPG